jgi:spore coat protein U-like protein
MSAPLSGGVRAVWALPRLGPEPSFGNTIGINALAGTGSGLAQSVMVYGRIAPQAPPSSGTYNDTIVVTLTY